MLRGHKCREIKSRRVWNEGEKFKNLTIVFFLLAVHFIKKPGSFTIADQANLEHNNEN